MSTSVIDQAKTAKQKKADDQADQWNKLVARVADGKVTSGVELSDRLDELGRSTDDLAAAVKALDERRARQRQIKDEPRLTSELQAAEDEIESAKVAAAEATKAATETWERLGPVANGLRAQLSAIRSARVELQRTCPPDVRREMESVSAEMTRIGKRRGVLDRLLTSAVQFVNRDRPGSKYSSFAYRQRAAESELRSISPKRTIDFAKREKNAKAALAAVAKERKAAQSEFDSLSSQLDGLQREYSAAVEKAIAS